MRAALLAALLLSGCASGAPQSGPMSPFTDLANERNRAKCLAADAIWCETQDQAMCQPRSQGSRERAER